MKDNDLTKFFYETKNGADWSKDAWFLSHISDIGWILNEGLFIRSKNTGLFYPTRNWKRRGEVAIAVIANLLAFHYNEADDFRRSSKVGELLFRSQLAMCTQFWRLPEFNHVKAGISLDYRDLVFEKTKHFYNEAVEHSTMVGLAGVSLENDESNAMVCFAAYCQGMLTEFYR